MKYLLILFSLCSISLKAQQFTFTAKQNSVIMFAVGERTLTYHSTKTKLYHKLESSSYDVAIFNKGEKVFVSLFRNNKLFNRLELNGAVVYTIVSLNPNDTLDIEIQ